MAIDVAIFDCDGVLILDTLELYDEALTVAIRAIDPDVSDENIVALQQSTQGKSFHHQLRQQFGATCDISSSIEAYESYIHQPAAFRRIRLLDGAEAELQRILAAGKRLALATGMNPSLLDRLFSEGILPDLFETVARVHDIPESHLQKPHPRLLLQLLSSTNVEPEQACYIGDTLPDIEMARNAGVVSVAVLTGSLDRTQAVKAKPDYILESMLEVHTIL